MEDRPKRDALRENARHFVESNNWDVKKSVYLDLLDGLVKCGKKPF